MPGSLRNPYKKNIGNCEICLKLNLKTVYFLGKDYCLACFNAKQDAISARDNEYREKLFQTVKR